MDAFEADFFLFFFFFAFAFVFLKYESITLHWWNLETESGFVIWSDEHNYCTDKNSINGVSHCFVSFFFDSNVLSLCSFGITTNKTTSSIVSLVLVLSCLG